LTPWRWFIGPLELSLRVMVDAVLKRISHIFPYFAIELLHLYFEFSLQVVDMLLVLEHLLAELVSLVY
jgi:hypothetical protein